MKKFEIIQNYKEINWRNKHEIEEGCTTKQDNQQAKILKSFDNKNEALQELWKYRTDIAEYSGSAGTYYAITEYYVEENIYNKDGEWVEGGDIWEYSKMPSLEKKYVETRIVPHHSGFGMYQVEEYGEAFDKEDILDAIAEQYDEYYILGENELPEDIEDIRGKIYGEPEIVIAVKDPYGWGYIGLNSLSSD